MSQTNYNPNLEYKDVTSLYNLNGYQESSESNYNFS